MILFNFITYRISAIVMLVFVYLFLPHRYRNRNTLLILGGSFLLSSLIDYGYFYQGIPSFQVVFTGVQILVMQATALLVSRFRDFRGLFVGIAASTFVLPGYIVGIMVNYWLYSPWLGIILNALVCILVIAYLYFRIRDSVSAEMKRNKSGWLPLCIVAALFYVAVYSSTIYPTTMNSPANSVTAVVIVLIMIEVYVIVFQVMDNRNHEFQWKRNNEILSSYAATLEQQMKDLQERNERAAIIRHDTKHYIGILANCLQDENYQKMRELLEDFDTNIFKSNTEVYCENIVLNGIFAMWKERAEKKDIAVFYQTVIPENLPLNELELGTVISNLLDNSVNAAFKIEEVHQRKIIVSAHVVKTNLIVEIANTFGEVPIFDENNRYPVSTRGEGHGLGLRSVEAFVEKNDAMVDYTMEEDMFYVRLLIGL